MQLVRLPPARLAMASQMIYRNNSRAKTILDF